MTKQLFIIYSANGDIVMHGREDLKFVEERINSGENVILTDGFVSQENYKVNVDTKEIVLKNHEDIPTPQVSIIPI